MQKDTAEIVKQLQLSSDFQCFYRENQEYMVDKSLAQLLEQLLKATGISKAKAIKNAEMSEIYGYHIFAGTRIPERGKVLALAIGMGLELEQVQQLLKTAGYSTLYVKRPFDSVVLITNYIADSVATRGNNGENFGVAIIPEGIVEFVPEFSMLIAQINELLYDYGMETLGQNIS